MTSGVGGGAAMAVVGAQFCMADSVDLTVPRTTFGGLFGEGGLLGSKKLEVTDVNGDVVLIVKYDGSRSRVIADAAGNPIATLKQRVFSNRDRWEVFQGHSTNQNNLIFSLRTRSMFSTSYKLYVYMAANTSEQVCDFRIEGNLHKKSCTIFFGDSNIVIAEASKRKIKDDSRWSGKKTVYGVIVNPNMDHAFVLTLIEIAKEVYAPRSSSTSHAGGAGGSSGAGGC